MTAQEIINGNVRIAHFMGWRIDNSFPDKDRVWRRNNCIELDTTFKFHTSWNALMPVIVKLINQKPLLFDLYEWFNEYQIETIEQAWKRVLRDLKDKKYENK